MTITRRALFSMLFAAPLANLFEIIPLANPLKMAGQCRTLPNGKG